MLKVRPFPAKKYTFLYFTWRRCLLFTFYSREISMNDKWMEKEKGKFIFWTRYDRNEIGNTLPIPNTKNKLVINYVPQCIITSLSASMAWLRIPSGIQDARENENKNFFFYTNSIKRHFSGKIAGLYFILTFLYMLYIW